MAAAERPAIKLAESGLPELDWQKPRRGITRAFAAGQGPRYASAAGTTKTDNQDARAQRLRVHGRRPACLLPHILSTQAPSSR